MGCSVWYAFWWFTFERACKVIVKIFSSPLTASRFEKWNVFPLLLIFIALPVANADSYLLTFDAHVSMCLFHSLSHSAVSSKLMVKVQWDPRLSVTCPFLFSIIHKCQTISPSWSQADIILPAHPLGLKGDQHTCHPLIFLKGPCKFSQFSENSNWTTNSRTLYQWRHLLDPNVTASWDQHFFLAFSTQILKVGNFSREFLSNRG